MMRFFLLAIFLFPQAVWAADYAKVQVISTAVGEAWLVEDHSLPVLNVQLLFDKAGSAHDSDTKQGRARMAASLLDQGAGDRDALAFQKTLEDHAIDLAFSEDRDTLIAELHSLSEHKDKAFSLLGEALTRPRFDEDAIAKRKRQMLAQIQQAEKEPQYQLMRTLMAQAYPGHPYGRAKLGEPQHIEAMTRQHLVDYHARYVARDNMIISAAGDITAEALKALLEKYLAALPEKSAPDTEVAKITMQGAGQMTVKEQDMPQTIVAFATPGIAREDERYMAAYVLNHLLGGDTLTSVFGKAIRDDKGLAYYFNSYLSPMRHSAQWGGMFATRNDQVKEAHGILVARAKELSEQGVAEQMLEDAKRYVIGSFVLSLDTNEEVVSYLTLMQHYRLGADYLERRNAEMAAVTKSQVDALAAELLPPERWLTVMLGKPKDIFPTEAAP